MPDRLFSAEELTTLSRSPWLAVVDAIEASDSKEIESIIVNLEEGARAQIVRYTSWISNITEFAVAKWGHEGGTLMTRTTRAFFAVSPDVVSLRPDDPLPAAAQIAALVAEGDNRRANEVFDEVTTQWRRSIDLHRDWISALLSCVYRTYGAKSLEAVLRSCGVKGLMGSMERYVSGNPRDRLVDFVRLLHGHFTELSVSEDDKKFIITQDPCGTCTRQIRDGRYGPPLNLALVQEDDTWSHGTTTIYRAHVPIWHVELAREQLGVPWPVNQCPRGLETGACRILLYKDPYDPETETEVSLAQSR